VRRAAPALLTAAMVVAPLALAACGGRASPPSAATLSVTGDRTPARTRTGVPGTTTPTAPAAPAGTASTPPPTPAAGTGSTTTTPSAATHASGRAPGDSTQDAVLDAYESYLGDLSDLDDTLNEASVTPLASVTTQRLAQATVRQAAALLAAHEHGVGTLRDDHDSVVMTGPDSAVVADCQDEEHFSVVSDTTGAPDPFVARGDFAGSAQLVLQNGHWLVDVFTTTHVACAF